VRFGVHEFAWLAIGAAFGANLIFGLHLWLCGHRRRVRNVRIIADIGRNWVEATNRARASEELLIELRRRQQSTEWVSPR
jgi:hypothetical protein